MEKLSQKELTKSGGKPAFLTLRFHELLSFSHN